MSAQSISKVAMNLREDTALNEPAQTRVYETLRARIIAFDYVPGKRLSRPELAEQFQVSASPLREALQRLEQDGLVATFRQSRTVVTHIDPGLLKQAHFFRTGIECEVVNALASAPDAVALKKIAAIIRMQKVLVQDVDQIELFRNLDEDFHRELFEAAGQGTLHRTVINRSSQMARLRTLDLPRAGKLREVVEAHEAILDAIMAGERHAAADAMRAHLSGTIARFPEIMAQFPDYFVSAK